MPANLTPQYLEAEARYRAASDTDERLAALDEMLALLPKHKGTDKIQADIRRRISKLKTAARKKGKSTSRRADPFVIRREGAGQLVLLGPPNAGKSSLVGRLTRASPEVALYPFTTHKPIPGIMKFEDVPIQLVDAPPVSDEYMEPGMTTLLRSANVVVVLADLEAADPVSPIEAVLRQMERLRLCLSPPTPQDAPNSKRTLWLANKSDCSVAKENLELLEEFCSRPWLALSATTGEGTEEFAYRAFEALEVLRIYTKPPGKPADLEDPTLLKRGATVLDAVRAVHREFIDRLRFVRLWRGAAADEKGKTLPSGIKVERDFVLLDKDILEIHVER
jgi:ribosome-interacting GTPase 1